MTINHHASYFINTVKHVLSSYTLKVIKLAAQLMWLLKLVGYKSSLSSCGRCQLILKQETAEDSKAGLWQFDNVKVQVT